MSSSDQLLNCRVQRDYARCRVFCFPWLGGGSSFYANWFKALPAHVEVYGIRLPGRETRSKEPFYKDLRTLIEEVGKQLLPKLREMPFIFFAHSFGTYICYEMVRYLVVEHNCHPHHVIVSGVYSPHSKSREEFRGEWQGISDEVFLSRIHNFGGTPPELLKDKELLNAVVPIMRADISLLLEYREPLPDPPFIACPLTFFNGTEDRWHHPEEWAILTSNSKFHSEQLPGGHFYILEQNNIRTITKYISKIASTL